MLFKGTNRQHWLRKASKRPAHAMFAAVCHGWQSGPISDKKKKWHSVRRGVFWAEVAHHIGPSTCSMSSERTLHFRSTCLGCNFDGFFLFFSFQPCPFVSTQAILVALGCILARGQERCALLWRGRSNGFRFVGGTLCGRCPRHSTFDSMPRRCCTYTRFNVFFLFVCAESGQDDRRSTII